MTKAKFLKLKKVTPSLVAKRKKWIFLLLPLALSLSFQLYMSNIRVGRGGELAKIETQIEDLKRQNQVLKEQIARESAITRLEEEGTKLGLVKPEKILYTEIVTNTASNPTYLGQSGIGN